MAEEAVLITGVVGMGVATIGVLLSCAGAAKEARAAASERRAAREQEEERNAAWEAAQVHDLVRNDLLALEWEIENPKPPVRLNYRHNLHCPRCGRFSSRVFPDSVTVVSCKIHGIQVRWKDEPVEWANQVALSQGIAVHLGPAEEQLIELVPITQPIMIITPDDISALELEELGAVL